MCSLGHEALAGMAEQKEQAIGASDVASFPQNLLAVAGRTEILLQTMKLLFKQVPHVENCHKVRSTNMRTHERRIPNF